jgi:endonuclease/exonuclease/phosphatase family metal-dependent hydrolase
MNIVREDKLKIITMNTLHNTFKLKERIIRIAYEIKEENPDVVCLQEILFDLNNDTESSSLKILTEITGLSVVSTDPYAPKYGHRSGTAILSRLNVCESGTGFVPEDITKSSYNSCYAVLESGVSRPVVVFSIHGVWSGDKEYLREKQFLALNTQANELETKYSDRSPIVLFCGDFNSVPDSSSLRFLKGLSSLEGQGSYWVDCWENVGVGEGITSDPLSKLGQITARSCGIMMPERIPARRIDYTLVKGWVYGQAGSPLSSKLIGNIIDDEGYTPSDHYGICSELWNPREF